MPRMSSSVSTSCPRCRSFSMASFTRSTPLHKLFARRWKQFVLGGSNRNWPWVFATIEPQLAVGVRYNLVKGYFLIRGLEEVLRQSNPLGRPEPGNADFEDYDPAILSVGSRGKRFSRHFRSLRGVPGRRIDRDMGKSRSAYHQLRERAGAGSCWILSHSTGRSRSAGNSAEGASTVRKGKAQ